MKKLIFILFGIILLVSCTDITNSSNVASNDPVESTISSSDISSSIVLESESTIDSDTSGNISVGGAYSDNIDWGPLQ